VGRRLARTGAPVPRHPALDLTAPAPSRKFAPMSSRDEERRSHADLAESIRRLIDVTVSLGGADARFAAAARRIDAIAEELRGLVPEPLPPRYPQAEVETVQEIFPYDIVMGDRNPAAPPLRFEWRDPLAIGRAVFGRTYEGPPGCVHGAVIAAAFDQVLNIANIFHGTPGPTVRLELDFRRPTPLGREVRFEGWREKIEERRIYSAGRLRVDDQVTVEARGIFKTISLDRLQRLTE
jgi:hypothetical protein